MIDDGRFCEGTALVTGANRGLGLGTVRELARHGYTVLLASRDPEGQASADRLARQGLSVEAQSLDVTDADSIGDLARRLADRGLTLDVLVNNAGISLGGLDGEVARRTIETNVLGPMHVTRALLPRIADGGQIVMVSSELGTLDRFAPALRVRLLDPALSLETLSTLMDSFVAAVVRGEHRRAGWPSSAYGVSKAGLNALTRVLSRQLAPRSIRVNAVCPGWVRTDMGGQSATRSLDQGVASIVWPIFAGRTRTGLFLRDGVPIEW